MMRNLSLIFGILFYVLFCFAGFFLSKPAELQLRIVFYGRQQKFLGAGITINVCVCVDLSVAVAVI